MSAMIIPFPGQRRAAEAVESGGLQAVVNVERMHDYRIMSCSTMQALVKAQRKLVKLTEAYEKSSRAPAADEFKDVIWEYAAAIRTVDWADKFLMVHGQLLSDDEQQQALRRRYRNEIAHKPRLIDDPEMVEAVLQALGDMDDE